MGTERVDHCHPSVMAPPPDIQGQPPPLRESASRAFSSAQQTDDEMAANPHRPGGVKRARKKFVLCFDGTGNKFSGTDADSNILKIYRMLDRNDGTQFHYYQPGIGTYVSTSSLHRTGTIAKVRSAYAKAKDSAVGTSFADHVMGGYKFLMRYYLPGDDIFFFGFSRGAYTARFLAEMLDHVGLLTAGNEEMCHFAWKTFQKWQQRGGKDEKERAERRKMLEYMCAFRETFSRPVRRIRFLGLFDTVNSVPAFENAWMQRSKFPYTARSTAKVIRHAVAIDERRAKFRQDLISQERTKPIEGRPHNYRGYFQRPSITPASPGTTKRDRLDPDQINRGRQGTLQDDSAISQRYRPSRSRARSRSSNGVQGLGIAGSQNEATGGRGRSPGYLRTKDDDTASIASISRSSFAGVNLAYDSDEDSDEEEPQDIEEIWFAGGHADIGGGWPLDPGVDSALSHVPLVWMVREAQRAGLVFDEEKLRHLNCHPDEDVGTLRADGNNPFDASQPIPQIAIESPSPNPERRGTDASILDITNATAPETTPKLSSFHVRIHSAATLGRIHDVLQRKNGVPTMSVIAWNFMEYLPFRRMDLQEDGSWKSISWPLPKGETRDIPHDAKIHGSVIKRMAADETYRPGNLICGGGGRGVRHAPKELGTGEWRCLREDGDCVGEVFVRAAPVHRIGSTNGIKKLLKRDSEKSAVSESGKTK